MDRVEGLIKEAEGLCRKTEKAFKDIQKDCWDGEDTATLLKSIKFFKAILIAKNNIVDLSEVWHDLSEPAYKGGYVLLCDHPKFIETVEPGQVIWGGKICPNAKYAFFYDLIPKVEDGGAS